MENVTETTLLSPKGTFPAKVVKVIDGSISFMQVSNYTYP